MTVYVPQNQTKLDPVSGGFVSSLDLSEATQYGEIRYLLSPTAKPFINPKIINQLHDGLQDFSDDDFLLLIGNPAIIGMVSAIAAHYNNGNIKFLQWGKDTYVPVTVEDLFLQEPS